MAENVVISEDFRTMTVPLEQQVLGAMGDAWVRKVRFIVPRYCDGTDLSTYQFSVHFINNVVNEGYYPVPSITTNADTIEFDWLVSPIACANVGTTTASISATDSDGETIAHRFSSTTYSFKVLPSNDTQDQSIIEQAGAMDVLIAGWRELVDAAIADAEEAAANAQEVADGYAAELAKKANADSHATDLTAGFADNLTPSGEPVSAEFIARESGGDGAARIEAVKGNTVVWNQMVQASDFATATSNGVTYTNNGDGSITVNGTASGTAFITRSYQLVKDHVYLVRMCPAGGSRQTYFGDTGAGFGNDLGGGLIGRMQLNSGSYYMRTYVVDGVTVNNLTFKPQLFDLTSMFGAGNEPATVAEFEALYPANYYQYDAGALLPVRMEGVETVGFNQWDEEWELGGIVNVTGQNYSTTDRIRAKNYNECFPSTAYYFKPPTPNMLVYWYDADKVYIKYEGASNTVITSPSNAHFFRIVLQSTTTYNHDICINLSHSGYRNGEYEPYWKSTRSIPASTYFPDGMKSAGTVRDELTAGRAVKRVGAVDLGTLDWGKYNASGETETRKVWATTSLNKLNAAGTVGVVNMTSSKYAGAPCITSNAMAWANGDKTCSSLQGNGDRRVYVRDDSLLSMTPAEFKQAMSGVILYYELATPVTTEIDPPLNLDYKVDGDGTERIAHTEPTAPVPLEIAYGIDAAATLASLPTDYISHASMARFIAAIEQHFGVTVTETWDEANKRYDYTIA